MTVYCMEVVFPSRNLSSTCNNKDRRNEHKIETKTKLQSRKNLILEISTLDCLVIFSCPAFTLHFGLVTQSILSREEYERTAGPQ